MRAPRVSILGVASSAGTHHAGQELAPAALRAAGLVERLQERGLAVDDAGDIVTRPFVPDGIDATARNLAAVVDVARTVATAVEGARRAGTIPVVVGGDCTITLGVVAGMQRCDPDTGLLYLDGDADLATPATTSSGVLDAMGIAHVLGLADTDLARIGATFPMLTDDRVALLGYDESDRDTFASARLGDRRPTRFADRELREDPAGCARRAVDALAACTSVVVHFDVDAVDSRDLPLANYPHYGTGVDLATAGRTLTALCAAPGVSAVVLTEVNPTHDPSGDLVRRYVDTVTRSIADGLGAAGRTA